MRGIPCAIGFDGALDGLLGHACHDEQLLFQIIEVLMKFDIRVIRTCPVM